MTFDLRPTLIAADVRLEPLSETHRDGLARAADAPQIWEHMPSPDGSLRDSVYFSVIRDDWPAVRHGLAARLRIAELV
jgi:hypothetical protein